MRRPGFLGDLSDTWFGNSRSRFSATKLEKLAKEIQKREDALEDDEDDDGSWFGSWVSGFGGGWDQKKLS